MFLSLDQPSQLKNISSHFEISFSVKDLMICTMASTSILLCTFNSELKLWLQNYSTYFVKNIFVLYQQFKRMYEKEMHIFFVC